MGRLQSVAIRKPGDLPARLYGAAAPECGVPDAARNRQYVYPRDNPLLF